MKSGVSLHSALPPGLPQRLSTGLARRGLPRAPLLRALLSLLLLLGSCYNPDYSQASYACGPQVGTCPAGYQCVAGTCRSASQDLSLADLSLTGQDLRALTPDLLMTSEDLRMAPPDLRVQSGPDLSTLPDLRTAQPDQSVPGGCTGTGIPVSPDGKVYACNGNFDTKPKDSPDKLCTANFHLCAVNDGTELKTVNDDTCRNAGGFYAANIDAMLVLINGNNGVNCPVPGPMANTLVGCGSQSGTEKASNDCLGLKGFYHCGDQSTVWSCMTSLADATHNSAIDAGGVLCCAN